MNRNNKKSFKFAGWIWGFCLFGLLYYLVGVLNFPSSSTSRKKTTDIQFWKKKEDALKKNIDRKKIFVAQSPKDNLLQAKNSLSSSESLVKEEKSAPAAPSFTPYQEKTSEVFYEVHNDWAISFGDVILGKIENSGRNIKRGHFRPPSPDSWKSNSIPYAIHRDLKQPDRVTAAINYFNENTAVRFVPLEDKDEDALIFVPDDKHCASYIGRIGGMQPIMVADKCGKQDLIHELMHALGFIHEHSRPDRDQFLEVLWDKIDPIYWPQFAQVPDTLTNQYRGNIFSFDPLSAMLYPPTAFAKLPGDITLRATGQLQLAPTLDGLSAVDRERLFVLFGQ